MRITAKATGSLVISEVPVAAARMSRGAQQTEPVLPSEFQSDKTTVEKTYAVSLSPAAPSRATAAAEQAELPMIAIDAETAEGEAALVVLRHASGAITFHTPDNVASRRGAAGATYQFRIPLRRAHT